MFSCGATTCCGSAGGLNEEITAEGASTAAKRASLKAAEASAAGSADATLVSDQLETEKKEKLDIRGESPFEESAPKFEEVDAPPETARQKEDNLIAPKLISVQVKCSPDSILGITIDMADDDVCFVKSLKSTGLVPSYNGTCAEGQDVQLFHRLVSVNSNRDKTKDMVKCILNSIATGAWLSMDFQPPVQFFAAISTNSGQRQLGLEAYKSKEGYLTPVAFASEGALQDYNATVDSTRHITRLSRIIAVNGQSCMNGNEILEKMNTLHVFSLTVLNWLD